MFVDLERELTLNQMPSKEIPMLNALTSQVGALKPQPPMMETQKVEKKAPSQEQNEAEQTKVDRLKKAVENGEYKLDMALVAKAIIEP